ncbi:MAG: RusA family crossover junction endodeoxyribonuclease [Nitrospira sp.]|nr:RusA family crossover junction endodeoxyribonuclease [Nitrospira sp.]
MKNSRGRTTRAPGVAIAQFARDTAIDASSGSRRKPKWPRLSTEAFVHATHFSLTDDALSITLPIPPSINRQYATVNGRRVLSATGRRYKGTVGQLLMTAGSSSEWHAFLRKAREHGLALTIRFHFPTLLRRDLDGGLKIAQDALCEAMSLNDNRIMEIHLYKTLDRDNPRLECTLALTSPLSKSSTPPRIPSSEMRPLTRERDDRTLPHLPSPYKGKEEDRHAFLSPAFVRRSKGR